MSFDKSIEDMILMTIYNLKQLSPWDEYINYKSIVESLGNDIISVFDVFQYHIKLHNDGFIIIKQKHNFYIVKLTPNGNERIKTIQQFLNKPINQSKGVLENLYFLSHSSADKPFARRLAHDLIQDGLNIFLDEWDINIGESIVERVNDALERMKGLILILSNQSIHSNWVKKELNSVLMKELDDKTVTIFPVLKETCKIPIIIQDYKFSDFRYNYQIGLSQLKGYLREFN